VAAATVRHHSAKMLGRLGGRELTDGDVVLGPFFDDHFRCQMHVLEFDSRRLSPRFERMAQAIEAHFVKSNLTTWASATRALAGSA
jgi:hypothetical protein